jgi:N-sulfoglucosamine sulfohydrolase
MRVLAALLLACVAAAAADQPNLLLITADDLGLQLGVYGEKRIRTPRLDAFARESMLFETAWVAQASCSPSRSAMFTGLYPHANGQYGLTNTGFALHEDVRKIVLPRLLRDAGYRTGIIGKLHVNPEEAFPFDYRDTNSGSTRMVRSVAQRAAGFLAEAGEQPFFLMVNYSDPHAYRESRETRDWYFPKQIDGLPQRPIEPSKATLFSFQRIDTPAQRTRTANYLNTVMRLDAGVGMLLDELDKAGKADDTVVLFVGDHGPPFNRGKKSSYDAGLHVPLFVRWPGVSKPGRTKALASTVDIAPTFLDAAGLEPSRKLHGRSLRDVVSGASDGWREALAGEFHFHGSQPFYPMRTVRDQRYQLIRNLLAGRAKPSPAIDGDPAYETSQAPRYEGTDVRRAFDTFANPPEYELYDLREDPDCFHNLAGNRQYAEVQARLAAELGRWREETDDPFLDPAFVNAMLEEGAPAERR